MILMFDMRYRIARMFCVVKGNFYCQNQDLQDDGMDGIEDGRRM